MQTINLFPTPVAMFSLDREITKIELDVLMSQEQRPNTGNTTSSNSYVLNRPELFSLRQFMQDSLDQYLSEVVQSLDTYRLRITQSWTNYTKNNQFHHRHSHPNSIISGVFYAKTDPNIDKIYFYDPRPKFPLSVQTRDFNLYNSASWWLEALPNRLMIFPSFLEHSVEQLKDYQEERISLSFNTFYQGTIGVQTELTELILD